METKIEDNRIEENKRDNINSDINNNKTTKLFTKSGIEINIKNTNPINKTITISVPQERIKKEFAEKINEIKNNYIIRGFRPGKAPRKIIEKRFKESILSDLRNSYLRECLEVLEKQKYKVIGEVIFPKEEEKMEISLEKPFNFEFQIDVHPEFELPNYREYVVEEMDIEISEEELKEYIFQEKKKIAELEEKENKISEENDMLITDIEIKEGDKTSFTREGSFLEVKDYDNFLGFKIKKEELLNKKVGDICKFEREIEKSKEAKKEQKESKEEQIEPKKEKITLIIKIKDIKRIVYPSDEELAKEFKYKNFEEYKKALKENLERFFKENRKVVIKRDLYRRLIEETEIDSLEKLNIVQNYVKEALEKYKEELKKEKEKKEKEKIKEEKEKVEKGKEKHELKKDEEKELKEKKEAKEEKEKSEEEKKKKEEELNKKLKEKEEEFRRSIVNQIKEYLVIEKICEKENIKVDERELEEILRLNFDMDEIKKRELLKGSKKEDLLHNLKIEKICNLLYDVAKKVKVEEKEEEEEENSTNKENLEKEKKKDELDEKKSESNIKEKELKEEKNK